MNIGDIRFKEAMVNVLNDGYYDVGEVRTRWHDGTPAHTKFITQYTETYDISKGEFPITTVKPTFTKTAIKEILWIWQSQTSDLSVLNNKYNVHYWNDWESKKFPGTIGHRYGYIVKKYGFMDTLLEGLKDAPNSRRYCFDLNQEVDMQESDGLHSCAFQTMWTKRGEYLDLSLIQRSNDVVGAYNINNIQYVALQMMVAHSVGLKPGKFMRVVQNLHIYDRHLEVAEEYLKRPMSKKQPRLIFEPKTTNFYEYTIDDFRVEDYEPQEQIKFELAL